MNKLEEHLNSVGWKRVDYGFGWAHPTTASTQVFEHAVEDAFDKLALRCEAAESDLMELKSKDVNRQTAIEVAHEKIDALNEKANTAVLRCGRAEARAEKLAEAIVKCGSAARRGDGSEAVAILDAALSKFATPGAGNCEGHEEGV